MKKKLPFIFLAILILVAGYFSFNLYNYKNYKSLADKYIINGEFKKAEKATKLAMKYNLFDSKEDNIVTAALENYEESKYYYDSKNYALAKESADKIDEVKLENKKFASDVINLKKDIEDKLETEQAFNQAIAEIQSLIDAGDFRAAEGKFSQFSDMDLDQTQLQKKNEMKSIVSDGVKQIEEQERAAAEEERLKKEEEMKEENKKKEEEALKELKKAEEEKKKAQEEAERTKMDKKYSR